jgi:AcrR family transcriptional regulator
MSTTHPTNADSPPPMRGSTNQTSGGTRRPKVEKQVEELILEIAFHHPGYGQDRVAKELRGRSLYVSASGVRYVWQRHNLETIAKRVRRIEEHLGKRKEMWTEEQFIARDRVRADKQVRSMAASMVGQNTGDISRSAYILAVASRVLREQGYDATSLRDIAKRAQIPMGSMYHHFQTKEELFAAVYEEGISHLIAAVNNAIARFDSPWDRLEIACVTHLQNLCGGEHMPAFTSPINLPRIHGPVKNHLTLLNDGYEDIYRRLIAALELPASVSPVLLRLQLLGALNWTGVWFKQGKSTAEEIAKNLICAFRLGLDGNAARR